MSDEKPDPSEVETLSDTSGVYQRDSDGNLRPIDDVVKWNDAWHKVERYPFTTGDMMEFEQMGEDIGSGEMCEILERKIHTPNRTAEEWEDTDPAQFMAIFELLVEEAVGEELDDGMHAQIQDELDKRATAGN